MNNNFLLLLLVPFCLLLKVSATAQSTDEFGHVTEADLSLNVCPVDTAAPAFVVYDKGEISFYAGEGTLNVLYKRSMRIKILRKAGTKYGEIAIPLYVNSKGDMAKDVLSDMKAYAYNLVDGMVTKTKIDPKTVFEQKVSDHLLLKKLAFPDVHEGSVLEIRYEIRSPRKFRLNDWVFQREIPVIYSECVLKYTPFFLYTYLLKNAVKFDEYREYQVEGLGQEIYGTAYKEGACKFVMKNVPAFTETDFISSADEYLITLHFQLNKFTDTRGISENRVTTWDELAKMLKEEESFGGYLESCGKVSKQLLTEGQFAGLAPAERFNAIVTWVKQNLSWNDYYRMWAENKPKDMLKRKSGSSAEINLFLCGMLNAAEIEAHPVLISTHGNSRVIRDYPFLDFFNYVMVAARVDNKWILTDGTERLCENTSFPARCINGKGLMVSGEKTSWVDITATGISSLEQYVRLSFTPGMDSLKARFTTKAKGYNALDLRNHYGNNRKEVGGYYSMTGLDGARSPFIANAGADSVMKPYFLGIEGTIPVEMDDQMVVIDPFCNIAIKNNPFDKPDRKYPVDLISPENKTLVMELIVPVGYRVKKLPEPFSWEHDQMTFNYISQVMEDKILIHAFYSQKYAVYPPEDYTKLRKYFDEIVKKLNEKIYLEKV